MLGAILDRFRGGVSAAPDSAPLSDALPPQLVAAITSAAVFFRSGGDGDPAPAIRCPALGGMFRHDGIKETAERVEQYFPGLTPGAYRRAAKLIADRCADLNATAHRTPRRARAGSWVMDPARW